MTGVIGEGRRRVIWRVGGLAAFVLSLAFLDCASAIAQEPPKFEVWDFGVVPRPAFVGVLLDMKGVQEDLRMTEAQVKELSAIQDRHYQKMQKARSEVKDRAKFRTTRDAVFKETDDATQASLTPEQLGRLDQIQLQVQGPLAFDRPEGGGGFAYAGPASRIGSS